MNDILFYSIIFSHTEFAYAAFGFWQLFYNASDIRNASVSCCLTKQSKPMNYIYSAAF